MNPKGKAEPRFDIDYAYGRQAELQIGDFLKWIAEGNGRVEVKRKRFLDWDFYIETHCDKGRTGKFEPSGILVTKAEAWAISIADTGISLIVPTDELRFLLDCPHARDKAETDGTCPTRGKLINLAVLLYRHKQRIETAKSGASPSLKPSPPAKPVTEVKPLTADDIDWSGRAQTLGRNTSA